MSAIKNISYFLAAAVLSKPLGFLLSFFIANVLGPTDFGGWITLMLIVSYSPIVALGTVETLVKQVPYYLGRKESAQIKEVEGSVMGALIIATVFLVFLAGGVLAILPKFNHELDAAAVSMIILAAAISCTASFYHHRFTAYEDFKMAGAMDFLRSLLALIFVSTFAYLWGLRGAAFGYMLHEGAMWLFLRNTNVNALGPVSPTYKKETMRRMISIGFPITILWWSLTLAGTVDRVVLGFLLGPMAVGHYGLGISAVTALNLVPMVVGRVLYPKVNKEFGQNKGAESIRRVVLSPTLALGVSLANLQLIALMIMPFLYNQLLPKYRPGLPAGQILMLGSYFGCLLRNGANYLIASNHEKVFLKYIIITLAFNIIGDICLVKMGLGLIGIAAGTSLAGLLLTSLVWRRVLLNLELSKARRRSTLASLYAPIMLLTCLLSLILVFRPHAFQFLNFTSILTALAAIGILNGLLYCMPIYREEMNQWFIATRR